MKFRWSILGWLVGLLAFSAAGAAETDLFRAASKAFQDGFYRRAAVKYATLVEAYPQSPKAAEAVLLQAQCLYKAGSYDEVVALLGTKVEGDAALVDRYLYWLGHARYAKGGFALAADTFGGLVSRFPDSPLALEAAYWQSKSLSRLGNYEQVVEVLQSPEGFRRLARLRPNDELVPKSLLILGEALLNTKQYQAWLPVRDELSRRNLDPELNWQWEHLNCRNYLADGSLEAARQSAANLVRLAEATKDPRLEAESKLLLGEAHESLGQNAEAMEAYRYCLAERIPAEYRKRALEKVISLELLASESVSAIERLSGVIATNAPDKLTRLSRLALGELLLDQAARMARTNASVLELSAATNLLSRARAQFDHLLSESTNQVLLGEAHLRKGETFALAGMVGESASEFNAALGSAGDPQLESRVRFKLGDALYRKGDYASALTNYQKVVLLLEDDEGVDSDIAVRSFYQQALAGVAAGELEAARAALDRLLEGDPTGELTYRAMLAVGEALMRDGLSLQTRKEAQDLLTQEASSAAEALKPDLRLLIAQTHAMEGDWETAANAYEAWLQQNTNHARRVEAQFDLGWLRYKAGNEDVAYGIYTNFVVAHKTDPLAARAHNWLGNYYVRKGADFADQAEKQFLMVFTSTNWPPSELTYRAQLMAGRMAVERQGWQEARDYFTRLINKEQVPSSIRVDAFFALGDLTRVEQVTADASPTERFEKAINIYSKIVQEHSESPKRVRALGEIANCHWTLALTTRNPERLRMAGEAYQKVVQWPAPDAAARSQAKVGLGNVRAAQARQQGNDEALLEEAINHYQDLVYGDDFYRDGELPDPFWVQRAGLEAGRLLEELGRRGQAVKLYQRLNELIPGTPNFWAERIKQMAP